MLGSRFVFPPPPRATADLAEALRAKAGRFGFENQLTRTVVCFDNGSMTGAVHPTALAIVVLGLACPVLAQLTTPAFEVATVRTSGPDSAAMSLHRQPGGRLVTSNTPLTFLINWAFSLDDGRLVGAPKGADSTRFDIVAKAAAENPGPGQLQMMMRALLAERFDLAVHTEKRKRNAYTLLVAQGGLKLTPVNPPDACVVVHGDPGAAWASTGHASRGGRHHRHRPCVADANAELTSEPRTPNPPNLEPNSEPEPRTEHPEV